MHTLKIGLVLDDSLDSPDGVQQYVTTLGDWLSAQGHEVRYLVGQTARAAEDPAIYSLTKNVKVRFNKNRLSIPLPPRREAIQQVLAKERFDVLHVQLPSSPFFGDRVVRYAPDATKVIGTFHIVGHHLLATYGSRLLASVQQSTLARFDHIVSVSDAAAQFAAQNFRLTDTPILPNVVDISRFKVAKPKQHTTQEIVFVGRLVERKGCQYLIEAIRRLRDRDAAHGVHVTICGRGPLEKNLKRLVHAHQLDAHITFTGFVSEAEKAHYLASADIAIFPSTGGESFGIVLLEAMAAGSGVVMGGNNVGYRTVLGAKAGHLLFDPTNSQEMADKIQLLLTNPALRRSLHEWQQHEILQYDVSVVGRKLLRLYTA